MNRTIAWEGKAVFAIQHVSRQDYQKFFDTEHISYKDTELSLEKLTGTVYALPADWLNRKFRILCADYLVFGKNWSKYGLPFPAVNFKIKCTQNGKRIAFYDLPILARAYIVDEIIEHSRYEGKYVDVSRKGD